MKRFDTPSEYKPLTQSELKYFEKDLVNGGYTFIKHMTLLEDAAPPTYEALLLKNGIEFKFSLMVCKDQKEAHKWYKDLVKIAEITRFRSVGNVGEHKWRGNNSSNSALKAGVQENIGEPYWVISYIAIF